MRAVYKKSIAEQVQELMRVAERELKEIDYIELTSSEWEQVKRETLVWSFPVTATINTMFGVELRRKKE